jgi:anti-sigma factor RsiW
VVVEHGMVVDALASFIAAYIVVLPEAQAMEPRQLQRAVCAAVKELRKGRVRRLWGAGKCVYRAVALGYGAFAAYTNPWMAEAVVRGLFTCVRYARMVW